jgi:hypothetical protein
VHDTVNIESVGIPMVFVASSEFVYAAAAQSHALGADPACVFVAHPIQDRTDAELRDLADEAFPALLEQILRAP